MLFLVCLSVPIKDQSSALWGFSYTAICFHKKKSLIATYFAKVKMDYRQSWWLRFAASACSEQGAQGQEPYALMQLFKVLYVT